MHDTTLAALFVNFARSASFAASMPLASAGMVGRFARLALALVLTLMAGARGVQPVSDAEPIYLQALGAALSGAAFGLSASIVAAAAAAGGATIDTAIGAQFIGLGGSAESGSGAFAKLYSLAFGLAFFSSGVAVVLIDEFIAAASNQPARIFSAAAAVALGRLCIESALTLAAPAICAGFIASVVSSVVARVAPRVNAMFLNAPLACALVLVLVLATAPSLLRQLAHLAAQAAQR